MPYSWNRNFRWTPIPSGTLNPDWEPRFWDVREEMFGRIFLLENLLVTLFQPHFFSIFIFQLDCICCPFSHISSSQYVILGKNNTWPHLVNKSWSPHSLHVELSCCNKQRPFFSGSNDLYRLQGSAWTWISGLFIIFFETSADKLPFPRLLTNPGRLFLRRCCFVFLPLLSWPPTGSHFLTLKRNPNLMF